MVELVVGLIAQENTGRSTTSSRLNRPDTLSDLYGIGCGWIQI